MLRQVVEFGPRQSKHDAAVAQVQAGENADGHEPTGPFERPHNEVVGCEGVVGEERRLDMAELALGACDGEAVAGCEESPCAVWR